MSESTMSTIAQVCTAVFLFIQILPQLISYVANLITVISTSIASRIEYGRRFKKLELKLDNSYISSFKEWVKYGKGSLLRSSMKKYDEKNGI
jgi:hypothetical protein